MCFPLLLFLFLSFRFNVKNSRRFTCGTCASDDTAPRATICCVEARRNGDRKEGDSMARFVLNEIVFFFLVSDGNAAGTGPGDPWTGGSGGVQPPYSGYAPPHLAQPAYPMHLPHDPMVRRLSLVRFFLSFFLSPLLISPPSSSSSSFLSIDSALR